MTEEAKNPDGTSGSESLAANGSAALPSPRDYFIEKGCAGGWYECTLCGHMNSGGLGGWTWGKHHCAKCKGKGKQ